MVRQYVGGGWHIKHLTDRVCELVKDDVMYRQLTGADGFVRLRAERGVPREIMLERATIQAQRCDRQLAFMIAMDLTISPQAAVEYMSKIKRIGASVATGEESNVIGRKAV